MMDLPSYLDRIGYSGSTAPTHETLRGIHRAHLLTVPFENLDVELGRKIVVDQELAIHKIVQLRRGGFCYELNGAFAALLQALGFRITLLSARVAGEKGGEGPEFDHLTLRVDLEEPWLADVGFGDSFLEPLKLQAGLEQVDPAGRFRLLQPNERLKLERGDGDARWKPQYSFTFESRRLQDFAAMCHYHQTSPDSHFTQNRICSRATLEGRITLSEMKLIITRGGQRKETVLHSEQQRLAILEEHFGISTDEINHTQNQEKM
jgi:N-hydroxyarylamine O-acetyltransferase